MAKTPGGRPTIFTPKDGEPVRAQALTITGSKRFEAARRRLAKLAGWEPEQVSDADTVEFMARGETDTLKYLEAKRAASA